MQLMPTDVIENLNSDSGLVLTASLRRIQVDGGYINNFSFFFSLSLHLDISGPADTYLKSESYINKFY
jgi:hypothetical protein